jgi:hypothetical protein
VQRILFAAFLISVSLLITSDGGAQSRSEIEKPVWAMELIKVKPGMFSFTLGYLDENWMRVREEAKRQGAVLNYSRIGEQTNQDGTILLLTEFKNQNAYDTREMLFDLILKQLPRKMSGKLDVLRQEDLYEASPARVYQDYSDTYNPRILLLSKN